MVNTVLICTVGGSPQPILKAIEHTEPEYVCFICTGRDPETGQPGSEKQITGKGLVIKANSNDDKPTLPNIPAQAQLSDEQFEICEVSADDLDKSFLIIKNKLEELASKFPEAKLIADYTGGTKTMTAALVTAVLENDSVGLQLVTGARADLTKVRNQTEYAISANIDTIRLNRAIQPYLNAWKRYAYDEAAQGLDCLPMPQNAGLRSHLNLLRGLSRGFAAWDRFDHKSALEALEPYRPRIGQSLGLHLKALAMLTENDGKRREPLQLYDLWLNAKRRASQGRYDDAVARIYRLLEWTAQWQLRIHADIDTADIPPNRIPDDFTFPKNRQGRRQAGLFQAWELLCHMIPRSPAADFFYNEGDTMLNNLKVRNSSILAHGFCPINQASWRDPEMWLEKRFILVLKQLIESDGGLHFDLDKLQFPVEQPVLL